MYLCKPMERKGVEMKPFLGKEEQILAHIQDEDRRDWLHSQFRHMYSNRFVTFHMHCELIPVT